MRFTLLTILLVLSDSALFSQESVFGVNNYIEYQVGNMPLVISVPHGGYLQPHTIPDRTCGVTIMDAYTKELAEMISTAMFNETGAYPHMVINHLHRRKLDPNREIAIATCGNQAAVKPYEEYHEFISMAQQRASLQFENRIFFIDLHGHGNPIQRIEWGYLLWDHELELSDSVLNTMRYINLSSMQSLALNNPNDYSHAALLRGENSLGTLFHNRGFPSVPSSQIPYPGTNTNYFSGGYITRTHTSYAFNNNIAGVQMELNYTGIRDSGQNRELFAQHFSKVLLDYLKVHFGYDPALYIKEKLPGTLRIFPNPLKRPNDRFKVEGIDMGPYRFRVFDLIGQMILDAEVENNVLFLPATVKQGLYVLILYDDKLIPVYQEKIIID